MGFGTVHVVLTLASNLKGTLVYTTFRLVNRRRREGRGEGMGKVENAGETHGVYR
jgi:hypothetical protein